MQCDQVFNIFVRLNLLYCNFTHKKRYCRATYKQFGDKLIDLIKANEIDHFVSWVPLERAHKNMEKHFEGIGM